MPPIFPPSPWPTRVRPRRTWSSRAIQAYRETAIYPRRRGYLAKLYVDIGTTSRRAASRRNQRPDLDADLAHSQAALEQARAAVLKAQTDLDLARRTLARYEDVQRRARDGATG